MTISEAYDKLSQEYKQNVVKFNENVIAGHYSDRTPLWAHDSSFLDGMKAMLEKFGALR